MDDLLAWLGACLDEIERAAVTARDATIPGWAPGTPRRSHPWEEVVGFIVDDASDEALEAGHAHALRHDPRAVLARVEAERTIARGHAPTGGPGPGDQSCSSCGDVPQVDFPCDTLRLLAYGHRFDHPGYQPEWAPDNVKAAST